jgi:hypothetical protein
LHNVIVQAAGRDNKNDDHENVGNIGQDGPHGKCKRLKLGGDHV